MENRLHQQTETIHQLSQHIQALHIEKYSLSSDQPYQPASSERLIYDIASNAPILFPSSSDRVTRRYDMRKQVHRDNRDHEYRDEEKDDIVL